MANETAGCSSLQIFILLPSNHLTLANKNKNKKNNFSVIIWTWVEEPVPPPPPHTSLFGSRLKATISTQYNLCSNTKLKYLNYKQ